MAAVPKLYHDRFNPLVTGYKFSPSSKYHRHMALLVKYLCQLIMVPNNQYIPKKCTTSTAGCDSDTFVNTNMNEPSSTDGFPEVNMLITKKISNMVKPQVKNTTM